MAVLGVNGRLLMIALVVCFIACVCETRGSRGGRSGGARFRFRSRSRYRYRSSGGFDNDSDGIENAGVVVGIIVGVIGGIIALVVVACFCYFLCCSDSSSDSSSNGIVLSNQTYTPAADTPEPDTETVHGLTSPTYDHDYKTSCDDSGDITHKGIKPPSYEDVVNQNESDLPYSSNPDGDLPDPDPSAPSGDFADTSKSPPEAGYSSGASSELPYEANATEVPSSFSSATGPVQESGGTSNPDPPVPSESSV